MSWESRARKKYEQNSVFECLAKLAETLDPTTLPFSEDELRTLAKRIRAAFLGSERPTQRLERYKAHLARMHGAERVFEVAQRLEEINNAIENERR
jgi:predicted Zn-dependent peptidase